MRNKILIVILIAVIAVFSYSGWQLYSIYHDYSEAEQEYSELEKKYLTEKKTDKESGSEGKSDIDFDIDFDSLTSINSDIVAWLELPACDISYPVLQTADNSYYLSHTFEKKENHSGAIFLDYCNKTDMSDYNTLIYGHNMKNGTMFGRLKKLYQETNLRSANPYFYIILKDDTVLKYEIFSYYIGNDASKSYDIPQNEADFQAYINYCLANSIEKTNVEVNSSDRVVTLATCSGAAGGNQRFLVHGVLRTS